MGIVDRDKLRQNHADLIERMGDDPTAGHVRPSVTVRLVEDVTVESSFEQYGRQFSFVGDEAATRAGRERGPSPLRYFLTGIGFCMAGWWAKGSAVVDCELDDLELDVRTFMDMRGEHALDNVPPHPQWLLFDVRVASPASPDRVLEMIDWGSARCPLGSLARQAVPTYERVTHNGQLIRSTLPAGLA